MSSELLGLSTTTLNFPIGLAIQGRPIGSSTQVRPWVMPRLDIARVSVAGVGLTGTNLGASGGLSVTSTGGFGVSTALDVLFVGGGNAPVRFSIGTHYRLGH